MASRIARCAFSAAIIFSAALAGALPARADAGGERIVPPPRAFIEFCYREPQQCPSLPASTATAMGDSGPEASANYWRLVFATDGPDAISPAPAPSLTPEWGGRVLTDVAKVNLAINRSLSERSDQSVYARQDFWALPLAHGAAAGDCEDFVLEKRRMLREMGYTERQMSIAIVKTPWGQNHAVLLVAANGGEVVLDNLSPHVQPWGSSSYTLLTRQSSDDPSMWIAPL